MKLQSPAYFQSHIAFQQQFDFPRFNKKLELFSPSFKETVKEKKQWVIKEMILPGYCNKEDIH